MKKNNFSIFLLLAVVAIVFISCANDFDPLVSGKHDEFMMFSVLDNRLASQIVYLQKAYQNESEKKNLTDYKVYLQEEDGASYQLRDTVINNANFITYYLPDYKIKRGMAYFLKTVKDSTIVQWSSVFVQPDPIDSVIAFYDKSLLDDSRGFNVIINFNKNFTNSKYAYIYKFQTFMEYEYEEEGKKITKYRQIPDQIQHPSIKNVSIWTFPDSVFKNINYMDFNQNRYTKSQYLNGAVFWAFRFERDYKAERYTIKRAFVVLNIIDEFTYNALMLEKWDEAVSARFDSPPVITNMITNSGSGLGVFGSYLHDTVNINIDESLISIFGYHNGQKK